MENIFYFNWEAQYLHWIQHLGSGTALQPILLALNNLFSAFGEELIGILILGLIYWGIDKEKGKRIGLIIIMASISNGMIKNIFHRLRPYQSIPDIKLLRDVDGYSFPSGHSANAGALYPSVAYEFKRKRWKWLTAVAIILPLLIALSRNYLGAHWPTDVIVGLLQGVLFFFLIEVLSSRIKNPKILYLLCLIAALPGLFYCRTDDYFSSLGLLIGFLCAISFEQHFVHFENTEKWYLVVLRTVGGGLIFVLVNMVLKKILNGLFEPETSGAYLMRVLRYAIDSFVLIGVYPLVFRRNKNIPSDR